MSRSRWQCKRGFTLVELLVVLLIIVILTAIIVPIVFSLTAGSQVRDAARTTQAMLAGARDRALAERQPRGVRLLVDNNNPDYVRSMIFIEQQDPLTGTCHLVRSTIMASTPPPAGPYEPVDVTEQYGPASGVLAAVNLVVAGVGSSFADFVAPAGPGVGTIRFEDAGPIYSFQALDDTHLLLLGPVYPPSVAYTINVDEATVIGDTTLFNTRLEEAVGIRYSIPRGRVPTADIQPTLLPSGVVIDVGQLVVETMTSGVSSWADASQGLSSLKQPPLNLTWPTGDPPRFVPYFDIMFAPNGQVIGTQLGVFNPPPKLWIREELAEIKTTVQAPGGPIAQRAVAQNSEPHQHAIVTIHSGTGYVTTAPPHFQTDPNDATVHDFREYYRNVDRGIDSGL